MFHLIFPHNPNIYKDKHLLTTIKINLNKKLNKLNKNKICMY